MKKYLPYILAVLLGGAIVLLFMTDANKKKRQLNERITLRKQDKIPYGTYVAYQHLEHIFPYASVKVNTDEPAYWESLSMYEDDQVLIIITGIFGADKDEMKKIMGFIEKGNDVFVSARYISADADEILNCSSSSYDMTGWSSEDLDKKTSLSLVQSSDGKKEVYSYPGRTFETYFSNIDTTTTRVLGQDKNGRTNFIHLKTGDGNLFVHTEPLAFSNYFILHKNNIEYYEKALSVLQSDATKVIWDEYYLRKRSNEPPRDNKSWFSVLMGMKNDNGQHPFRAAFWLLIGLLLVYVLMEMRRRQRYIPIVTKPRNDSLDFVKTIGRLYYDKGDHKNLCRKMSAFFLDHVRNKYKLATGILNESFITNLQYKSGVNEIELREIISFIKYAEDAPGLEPAAVKDFHKKLESFYSKT